jgi:hypothetical protein
MHIMAISTIADGDRFWSALKKAYGRMPRGAKWVLAVATTDGTKAVNVIVHDSPSEVREFFDGYAGSAATTEWFEADAANAVGLDA